MITLLNGKTVSDDEFYSWSAIKQRRNLIPRPAETLAKISKANTGRKNTAETKAKMSASHKGHTPSNTKPHSEATKAKIRASKLGKKRKPHSPATKAKMAAARKEFYAKRKLGVV